MPSAKQVQSPAPSSLLTAHTTQLDWIVAAATPTHSHPVNCERHRHKPVLRGRTRGIAVLEHSFAFGAPPLPTPFFWPAHYSLPQRFSSFLFIVTARNARNGPVLYTVYFFLRRSYPDLSYPFQTLDRKQTFFAEGTGLRGLSKSKIHPIKGSRVHVPAPDATRYAINGSFIGTVGRPPMSSLQVQTILDKETSSIEQQARAVVWVGGAAAG